MAHPPLITDTAQWHRVVLDNSVRLGVQSVSGSRQRYLLTRNAATRTWTLKRREDAARFLLVRRGFQWANEYPFNK